MTEEHEQTVTEEVVVKSDEDLIEVDGTEYVRIDLNMDGEEVGAYVEIEAFANNLIPQ